MANAGTRPTNRPLSPHLQIWRWGPHMLVSILHRVTGVGLSIFGLGMLLWFLGALASGPVAYGHFCDWVWADMSTLGWSGAAAIGSIVKLLFKVLLVGLSWALFQHSATGIRHFVLDTGAGYELGTNKTWSIATIVISLLLTALFWAALLLR